MTMEERLTRRNLWTIGGSLAITALALAIGLTLFPRVFPEAAIEFRVDRGVTERRGLALLDSLGYKPVAALHASRFVYDEQTKTFLERELGLARADSAFSADLRLWRWAHRWFVPGAIEEWRVAFATTGELAGFEHIVDDAAPGDTISEPAARALAEAFLRTHAALDLARWRAVGARTQAHPARVDHTFTWERRTGRWAGSPLRVTVSVQGDRVGAFRLGLEVPEVWSRGYATLRSRNETTGTVASVLYGLLLLGAAVAFVRRIPRGQVRWQIAARFALAASMLVLLARANQTQAALFDYDTREALSAFLAGQVFQSLVEALGLGLLVFCLTAGAEGVYRDAYPHELALEGIFSRRGLRTRRAFLAVIVGYALTALFFAYQAVFYLVADALGAWAPAEIPYDDLLTTAFPWAFVLLIGFIPAVTEELSARMFAIPALGRWLRSRRLAIVVAAAIWGFGHAGYANQPFYIRGLEVGLAGVFIGWVMLRFGILAALVWHYTVDAFYAALLLLRSRDAYLAGSAALAAGVLLVPFFIALIAYVRTGHFRSPEGLLNRDVMLPAHAASPEALATADHAEVGSADGTRVAYVPLPLRRWAGILGLTAIVLLALHLIPARGWHDIGRPAMGGAEACRRTRTELTARGVPVDRLRLALREEAGVDPAALRFGERQAGVQATEALLKRAGLARTWRVRAFSPGEPEEWTLRWSAVTGELLAWERRVADEMPGDSLDEAQARAIALEHARTLGTDPASWVLAESRTLPRPARRDHEFVWEARDPALRLGDAMLRLRVRVIGDRVGGEERWLQLPESWVHADGRRGFFDALALVALGVLVLGGAAYFVRRLERAGPIGRPAWRRALQLAGTIALVQLATQALGWRSLLMAYDTREPWGLFILQRALTIPFGVALFGLALAAGLAMLPALRPRLPESLRREHRRSFARDAALAGIVTLGWIAILFRLRWVAASAIPGASLPASIPLPPGSESALPLAAGLATALGAACVSALLLGLARFAVPRDGPLPAPVILLALAATLAATPGPVHSLADFLAGWLPLVAAAVGAWGLLRHVLRDNEPAGVAAALAIGCAYLWSRTGGDPPALVHATGVFVLLAGALAIFFLRGRAAPAASQISAQGGRTPGALTQD
jgi:membrane protease YdiL (CAAX protease family)